MTEAQEALWAAMEAKADEFVEVVYDLDSSMVDQFAAANSGFEGVKADVEKAVGKLSDADIHMAVHQFEMADYKAHLAEKAAVAAKKAEPPKMHPKGAELVKAKAVLAAKEAEAKP